MNATHRDRLWDTLDDEWSSDPPGGDGLDGPPRGAVATLLGVAGAALVATASVGVAGASVALTAALVVGGCAAVGFAVTAALIHRLNARWTRAMLEREGLVEELSQEFERRDDAIDEVRLGLNAARRRVVRLEDTLGNGRGDLADIHQELDSLEAHVRSLADALAGEDGNGGERRLLPNAQN